MSNHLEATVNARNFFGELKRRKVYKAAVAYVVVSWMLIQAASILLPAFDAPVWVMKIFVVVVVLGFILSVIISWAFDITPEGIKRTEDISVDEPSDVVRHLEEQARQQFVRGYLCALLEAGLGDKTKAIDYVNREYLNPDDIYARSIPVGPMFDLLHGEPRLETFANRTPETTRIGIEPTDTDDTATGEFDLISEDAARVKPELAGHEKNGKTRFQLGPLNATLLNEVLKELHTVQLVAAEA